MTTEQIEIVKENFNQIAPLADLVAAEFYERLFELDASLRPLFKEDLTEQKKKLMMMLKFAVGTLDRMEVFAPSLEELGRKHVAYGVRETHYETVGNALMLILRGNARREFDGATRSRVDRRLYIDRRNDAARSLSSAGAGRLIISEIFV